MKLWALPKIEYPATHVFESKLFTRLVYAGALVAVAVLATLNVAVVGYEPTVIHSSNFNDTQTFWFHTVSSSPEPGTLCDRRVFNVGESLVTNASIFEWKIVAITRPNAGKSGVAYGGTILNNCDVVQMNFNWDIRTWTIDITAYTACRGRGDLEVMAQAIMIFSPLPGRRGPLLRNFQYPSSDPVNVDLTRMFSMAVEDVGLRGRDAFLQSNRTGTVAASLSATTEFCPPSIGLNGSATSSCALQAPLLDLTEACAIGENISITPFDPLCELDDTLLSPISNMLHLALAAMRVDLGNPSPNNFLTHPDVLNRTLIEVFPETPSASSTPSKLYAHLHQQSLLIGSKSGSVFDPFRIPGPSVVQAVYVCKFLKRKSTGSLIVSVFVATAGFFTTGWGIFIAVACWVKQVKDGEPGYEAAASATVGPQLAKDDEGSNNNEPEGGGAMLSPVLTSASSVTYIV